MGIVGSISSPGLDLPGLLAGFHHSHPGVEITLFEAGSQSLVDGLRAGRLDVALVAFGATPLPGIAAEVIVDEPLVVAVSPDAIRDRVLVSLPRGTGLRAYLDDACLSMGFRPRICFEAGDPHLVAEFVSRGLGVGLLPESVTRAHAAQLRAITLTRPALRGRIALAWRAEAPASPAASAFLGHARAQLTRRAKGTGTALGTHGIR